MTSQEFINKIAPLVVSENSKRNYPLFSSVVIGQAICETRLGKIKYNDESKRNFWYKSNENLEG